MEEILLLIKEYSLFVVLVGLFACFITGAFKPLVKYIITKVQDGAIHSYINRKLKKSSQEDLGVDSSEICAIQAEAQVKYNDVWYKGLLTRVCNIIVVVVSVIFVVLWYILYLGDLECYANFQMWTDIFASASVSAILYAMYETTRLKKLLHYICGGIVNSFKSLSKTKTKNGNIDGADIVEILKENGLVLTEEMSENAMHVLDNFLKRHKSELSTEDESETDND